MDGTRSRTDAIQFWVLNVASFLAQLTISMVNLAAVYYLRGHFFLAADAIGLVTSATTACYLVFCLLGSSFCTRFKPRHLVELSLGGMALSVAAFAISPSIGLATFSLACFGAFMSLLWPQIEGWFSRGKEGKRLNRASNAFNLSWSIGTGLSPYVAGLLVERSNRLPFWVALVLFSAILLLVSLSSILVPGIRAVKSERSENREQGSPDASTPLRFYSWIGLLVIYCGMSVILTIFPLYGQDVLHISESTTGLLLLIRGMATCLTFVVLVSTDRWQFNKPMIIGNLAFFSLISLVVSRFSSLTAYALFFLLFGIVFAIGYEQSMFHGVSGCRNRSQRMVVHEVLLTIGTIIGAVFGGYLYERFSFSFVLQVFGMIAFGVVVVESVLSLFLRRKGKRVVAAPLG